MRRRGGPYEKGVVAEPGRWSRFELELPLPFADWVSAELIEWGCPGVEIAEQPGPVGGGEPSADPPRIRLTAYFPEEEALERHRRLGAFLKELGPQATPWSLGDPESVAPVDWAGAWRLNFPPLEVGERLLILPPWESVPAGTRRIPIFLQPGMAFGTGRHPSTVLVLEALEQLDGSILAGSVLDVGCGSGVLAIAAVLLGAECALAVDGDVDAVRSAGRNVRRNGLSDRISVEVSRFPELPSPGRFHLVLANVYLTFFEQHAGDLALRLAEGGRLLASGLEGGEGNRAVSLLRREGLEARVAARRNGWCLVEASHP